jgi:ATP-dependent Clp endopeptidase proteolytic subunit ClpP
MRPCFAFKPAAAADAPETLLIFDEIGFWGVQAKDFVSDLSKVQAKTLNVEINSPGGDVFAGLAIYNALKSSGKEIVVKVMGVAASAASLIAMAGDKIVMPKNSFMMIHNPWSFAMGNADELREQADVLDKIGDSLLKTYASRTGKDEAEIAEMLAKDTWMTADEALALGFATEVVEDVKANASFDMARADLPEHVKAVFQASAVDDTAAGGDDDEEEHDSAVTNEVVEPTLAEAIEASAKAAKMDDYAAMWAVTCTSLEDLKTRMSQAREIKAICAFAKKPEKADSAIKAGKSVADVRAELVKELADQDERDHTDTSKKNEQATGTNAKSEVTTAALWASHHGRK